MFCVAFTFLKTKIDTRKDVAAIHLQKIEIINGGSSTTKIKDVISFLKYDKTVAPPDRVYDNNYANIYLGKVAVQCLTEISAK